MVDFHEFLYDLMPVEASSVSYILIS